MRWSITRRRPYSIKKIEYVQYRPPFTLVRMHWEFHACDKDTWPSSPHGHCLEKPWKMDIGGNIYNLHTSTRIDRLSKKELVRLYCDKGFRKLLARYRHNGLVQARTPMTGCRQCDGTGACQYSITLALSIQYPHQHWG